MKHHFDSRVLLNNLKTLLSVSTTQALANKLLVNRGTLANLGKGIFPTMTTIIVIARSLSNSTGQSYSASEVVALGEQTPGAKHEKK